MAFDPGLRSPKEQPLFVLGTIVSSMFWLFLVLTVFGVFYGILGFVFAVIAHALFLAGVRGNGVRVSPRQFPELYESCQKSARVLGMPEVPEVYLLQADGALNAFATKLLNRKLVVILSDLADQCQDPRQLEFVVAHEMGHLAAGHLFWNAFLAPFLMLPWAGPAYLRAREYTADRCGLAVVGDLEPALRGLVVLAAGGPHAARADLGAFMEQRLATGEFWSAVRELVSTHPYLCKRAAALQELEHPGTVPAVGRNPLAYPLAPMLAFGTVAPGSGAGGLVSLLLMVAIIGIIAAITIPALLRARISANESAALGNLRTVVSRELAHGQSSGGTFAALPGLPTGTQSGYRTTLELGPEGRSFVCLAEPVVPNQTGVRTFCGDSRGILCATTGGPGIPVAEGRCDLDACSALP